MKLKSDFGLAFFISEKAIDDLGGEKLIFPMLLRSLDLLEMKFENSSKN
jgi:hypothetical protein